MSSGQSNGKATSSSYRLSEPSYSAQLIHDAEVFMASLDQHAEYLINMRAQIQWLVTQLDHQAGDTVHSLFHPEKWPKDL
jgi:hypothetical protein